MTTLTQAEKNIGFVTELFEAGEISDRFNEIDDADWDATSEDLCHIVFDDGTAISINPGSRTVEVD